MKLWMLTTSYVPTTILHQSLQARLRTCTYKSEHIILDHHYPRDYWLTRASLLALAESYNCKVMANYQNEGAHQGYNWLIANLPIAQDDLIITYDADSEPVTPGWDEAMVQVLLSNPLRAAVSLNFEQRFNPHSWHYGEAAGHRIKWLPHGENEMFNVSGWRASFLLETKGFSNDRPEQCPLYGHVESWVYIELRKRGLRHCYLDAYKELDVPIYDRVYQQWKLLHAEGKFKDSFAEFIKS